MPPHYATAVRMLGIISTWPRSAAPGCSPKPRWWNLYVCDGSVIAANLGVNPSLTICALSERAMSHIPPAAGTQ